METSKRTVRFYTKEEIRRIRQFIKEPGEATIESLAQELNRPRDGVYFKVATLKGTIKKKSKKPVHVKHSVDTTIQENRIVFPLKNLAIQFNNTTNQHELVANW